MDEHELKKRREFEKKLIKFQPIVKRIVSRYHQKYQKSYLDNAMDVEDLTQEGDVVLAQILQDERYKDKPEIELEKIIITAVGRQCIRLHEKSKKQNENIKHIPNPTEDTENEISQEEFLESLSCQHSYPDLNTIFWQDIRRLCTDDEWSLLCKKLFEGKTFELIGREYGVTEGRMSQKFSELMKKFHNKLKDELM